MVEWIVNFITNTFEGLFLEGSVIFGLIGLGLILIGATTVAVTLSGRLFQPKVDGTVLGGVAIHEAGNYELNGKNVPTKKARYYPVFEYTQADGSKQLTHTPTSGSRTFRYQTGQSVRLVISDGTLMSARGTAIDAGDQTGLIYGLLLMLSSLSFLWAAVDELASQNLGILSIIGIAASVILRRVVLPFFSSWNGKTSTEGAAKPERLSFDPKNIKPIAALRDSP